jgi:hypothetical protein
MVLDVAAGVEEGVSWSCAWVKTWRRRRHVEEGEGMWKKEYHYGILE